MIDGPRVVLLSPCSIDRSTDRLPLWVSMSACTQAKEMRLRSADELSLCAPQFVACHKICAPSPSYSRKYSRVIFGKLESSDEISRAFAVRMLEVSFPAPGRDWGHMLLVKANKRPNLNATPSIGWPSGTSAPGSSWLTA